VLKRVFRSDSSQEAAVADRPDLESARAEIERLSAENRERRDTSREVEILRLRQLGAAALVEQAGGRKDLVDPDDAALTGEANVPEVSAEEVTPGLIQAAILRHGSILVRGLIDRDSATRLATEIERAFAAREAFAAGELDNDGYYVELQPEPPNQPITHRGAVQDGGGLLATDSPRVAFEMFDTFERAGLGALVANYLNESPAISADKTTLRKATPDLPGAWHQDGKFLGDVNSLNLWLSLSHCGDTAPGMDLVPRRLDHIVDAGVGDQGFSRIVVPHERAVELAGDAGIVRPIFEPGDAMFFDHLYLHQTASDPGMPNPRYAIESWFFGPSAFPEDYVALAF
jgi:hypothetical protein